VKSYKKHNLDGFSIFERVRESAENNRKSRKNMLNEMPQNSNYTKHISFPFFFFILLFHHSPRLTQLSSPRSITWSFFMLKKYYIYNVMKHLLTTEKQEASAGERHEEGEREKLIQDVQQFFFHSFFS
jgi:hypothetical protein